MAFSKAKEFPVETYLQSLVAKALSHPARVVILLYLQANGKTSFTELRRLLPLARTTVSQHLARLRDSELVIATQSPPEVYYQLNVKKCRQLFQLLGILVDILESDSNV